MFPNRRISKSKIYILNIITVWILLIVSSASWNMSQFQSSQKRINLETGRAFFELIVTTRAWNAQHNGVYVPIADDVLPNPYLEDPNRDLTTTSGLKLTKLNPAYMTRLIGEVAQDTSDIRFHITSLDPIRPENKPEEWEREALIEGKTQNKRLRI